MSYDLTQLRDVVDRPHPYPQSFTGRGIVISGGGKFLPSAYIAICSLRHSGCSLPIQLWHLGTSEFPKPFAPLFEALNVEPVDALEIRKIHPMNKLEGWQSKPFSILHCPFKEVFSFDADNLALRNPEFLFELPEYKESGAVFWPDFAFSGSEPWRIKDESWELLGLSPMKQAELESGQLLIDKEKSWIPLQVAFHMNDNCDFFYERCTYGDKDTYTLAWELCKSKRFVVPHRPKLLDDMVRLQFSPDGGPLFQHSRKWILPAERNAHLASYVLERECFEWLKTFERELKVMSKS